MVKYRHCEKILDCFASLTITRTMRNYRFYLPNINVSAKNITVKDEALLHKMNNVLRLTRDSKEDLEFFDGEGNIFKVELLTISSKDAVFKILNETKSQRELERWVKFYVPIIKPENYYWMIRKLTELGVSDFQPVFFSRSQKKYKESLEKQKAKIMTIIEEAVEQCGGAKIPIYRDILDFSKLDFSDISPQNGDISKFFAYEELSLEKKVQDLGLAADTVIMVGPEGGLTTDETQNLGGKGFIAVSLGTRLLKAETAAIALFSNLNLNH
jgi:16S rRNA (uracil1498-N3)-methyltransferase